MDAFSTSLAPAAGFPGVAQAPKQCYKVIKPCLLSMEVKSPPWCLIQLGGNHGLGDVILVLLWVLSRI